MQSDVAAGVQLDPHVAAGHPASRASGTRGAAVTGNLAAEARIAGSRLLPSLGRRGFFMAVVALTAGVVFAPNISKYEGTCQDTGPELCGPGPKGGGTNLRLNTLAQYWHLNPWDPKSVQLC